MRSAWGARSDPFGNLIEMKLHGLCIAGRQHEGGARSEFRAIRTERIGRLGALIVDGAWTRAFPGPAIGEFVLLADPISSWIEFPDGRTVLLTLLCEGQRATVLQLPARPMTAAEEDAQKRVSYVG